MEELKKRGWRVLDPEKNTDQREKYKRGQGRLMKWFGVVLLFLIGCASSGLHPTSGGSFQNGNFLLEGSGPLKIEIIRIGVGTQIGRIEAVIRNNSTEPIEIDHSKTIIVTDQGEQLQPLLPDQAADSLSADALSKTILGGRRAESAMTSSQGEVTRNGIGRALIQPGAFIKGAFFFFPPKEKMGRVRFTLAGFPGSPQVIFANPYLEK